MFSIKSFVGIFIISFVLSGAVVSTAPVANAAATGIPAIIELDGYMWSSTIGWISLNCKTGGTTGNDICGTGTGQSDYRVVISTSGNLSGYAWSSNVGWINFNPARAGYTGFPAGPGTVASNARVSGAYPALTFEGWARACAGTVSAVDKCDNMGSRTDGWDGWISLKGDNYQLRFHSGGGMYATSTTPGGTPADGFFWGSTNVGWVAAQASMKWSEISATLTGVGCKIESGQSTCSTTITWSFTPANITDPTVNQTSPTVVTGINTGGSASGNRARNLVFGANTFQAKTGTSLLKTLTLNASCKEDDDRANPTTGICEFDPTLTPGVVLTVENSRFIRSGEKVTLSWVVSGVADMSACKLTGPQAFQMTASTEKNDSWTVPIGLTSYSSYTLSCTTGTGTDGASVNVEVIPTVLEN